MKIRIICILIVFLLMSGCSSTFEIGLEPANVSANDPLATATTAPLPTSPIVNTATSAPLPASTVEGSVSTEAPAGTPSIQTVQIYLVALDDNGQAGLPVGCGDSAVPVPVEIQPTQGVLKAALEALLSIKEQYYGESGLYNALYQSDLQVESVKISDGEAQVYLTGSLTLGGECDDPRVQAQLEQTVLQFSSVTRASIFINGKPLADVLSLKG